MLATLFLLCAIVGGALFLLQLFLTLVGLAADIDGGAELSAYQDGGFSGLPSLRAVVAAIAFFGLAGKVAQSFGLGDLASVGIGAVTGVAAMLAVTVLLRMHLSLRAEVKLRAKNAIGLPAKVHLRIPPKHGGTGRVQIMQQGRTVDYYAMTASPEELPSGAEVVVVRVINAETVEVASPRARR